VLDPFAGAATTLVVANALGRRAIGLDLSREYLTHQAQRRLERPHAAPLRPGRVEPALPLFREED
jgi:tRNA G10  N-methylase Trm11